MPTTLARATAPLLALTLAWGLSACSSSAEASAPAPDSGQTLTADPALAAQQAALDGYVAASQASIPSIMADSGTAYSEIRITAVQPDTVEYAYVFTEAADPATAVAYFEDNVAALQDAVDSQVFPEMATYGITIDPKVRYSYYNPDGTQVWSHDFSPS